MRKKKFLKVKVLAATVAVASLLNFNVMPLRIVAEGLSDISLTGKGQSSGASSVSRTDTAKTPTSVDSITIPAVNKNPYDISVSQKVAPVYNTDSFNFFRGEAKGGYSLSYDFLTSYGTHFSQPEGASPYFTASLTPLFTYTAYDNEINANMNIVNKLPYREGRENMLHSELTLTNGYIDVNCLDNAFLNQIIDGYNINREQTYLRIGATMISGSGKVSFFSPGTGGNAKYYTESARVEDGKSQEFWIDVPASELSGYFTFSYSASAIDSSGSSDGIMTDFFVTLIDNTCPSVTDITVSQEIHGDDNADLVMRVCFNEGIRVTSSAAYDRLNEIYLELELRDLNTNKTSTVRMYLESIEANGVLIFRGDIGLYHYKNYRISRIKKFNMPTGTQWPTRGVVDLADEYYISAYDKVDYSNRLLEIDAIDNLLRSQFSTTLLSDYASNPINASSITNWSFGDQTFISNTFEATDFKLYTEQMLLKTEQAQAGERVDADLTDQVAGPNKTLVAYAYLDQTLTAAEACQVYIQFNIKNPDGTYLRAYATSCSEYRVDELCTNGSTTGTLLKFENIRLTQGMTLDGATDGVPLVSVTMGDDIEDKTAYPYVARSSAEVYADFDAPEVTLRKFAAYSNTDTDSVGDTPYYTVSVAIGIQDIFVYEQYADVLGTKMYVSISGGVDKDTSFRYCFTDSAVPPESRDGYTEYGVLSKDGKCSVGSTTLLNSYTAVYLHLMFETDDIYLEDLYIDVSAEDAVGNRAVIKPDNVIDYMIDEIPPELNFEHKYAKATEDNKSIKVTVGVSASDRNDIVRVLYCWGENPDEYDSGVTGATDIPQWQAAVFERGTNVSLEVSKTFGDGTEQSNKVYREAVYVKAIDIYGNESEVISVNIAVSTQKPSTDMRFDGDINAVSREHKVTVTGPAASLLDNSDAYTRVTVTPTDGDSYSYVTLVKTGESADILAFEGLTWYKVLRDGDTYTYVSAPETVSEGYQLSESSIMYGLFTYYGDIKISFENGYGSMEPVQGKSVSSSADDGSYIEDQNYLMLRFASPYDSGRVIHGVDFGAIIDRDDITVVANADKGGTAYKFNATLKGVNPMRNTQIHFTLSNIARSEFKLLDLDYEGSYAELYRVGENGGADVLVSRQNGLAATSSQYFTINNLTDSGEPFITGAYYLKVTVKSNGGQSDCYESSRLVLDAQTADNAGVWEYATKGFTTLESIEKGEYVWTANKATDAPFDSIGVSALIGGEVMRSRVFAVYSYGSTALSVTLSVPNTQRTYEGLTVGAVEGFRLWNILSEPTDEQINAQGFTKDPAGGYMCCTEYLDGIYTEDTIPTGDEGFERMYFVKGLNTFCYQVKMANGYVSPIRQFTVYVSDYAPELNIVVDNYQPSYVVSQTDGVVNASYIRFLIETAYSLNGSGRVDVDVWSDYGMNVGIYNEDTHEYSDVYASDPTYLHSGALGLLELPDAQRLKVGDYVDFTENSYTSDFPKCNHLCTAVFVATDEYGAITIVAPQIGDNKRVGNLDGDFDASGNVLAYTNELNINYDGSYFDDPYTVGDSATAWRREYNQPQYFGASLLGFKTSLMKNNYPDADIEVEVIDEADADLQYNLFNIVSNDISWGNTNIVSQDDREYVNINYFDCNNIELMRWQDAKITFYGGDLGESVELALAGEDNNIGYMGATLSDGAFTVRIAFPQATAEHPAKTCVTRNYKITCYNIYDVAFETEGTVDIYYIDYSASASMNKFGSLVEFSFATREYGTEARTGKFNSGTYTVNVTDYYGNEHEIEYTLADDFNTGTSVIMSQYTDTPNPVTVEISRPGSEIYVDITDYDIMSVTGDGSERVVVTLTDNTEFSYRYRDDTGDERMFTVCVDIIRKPNITVVWDFNEGDVKESEDGTRYRYGEVTAYLTDESFSITDRYSGRVPSFTFTPDGERSYTFKAEELKAMLGDETVDIKEDITVAIDFELYQTPDPLGLNAEDNETPNVQVLAYANRGGYYLDSKLALQLENSRNSTALTDYRNYKIFNFVGARANASELLKNVGWSTSYRFEVETVDMSRVRLFIKSGLYADAPDFESGISDDIDGVELNSKLITVTKNAKFTLFVVDSKNNVSSIAFDVNNLSDAPVPEIIKVTVDSGEVRGYIIPPKDESGNYISDFEIVGTLNVKTDTDSDSDYAGFDYIEYTSNDDYIVSYTLTYNSVKVSGSVNVSVSEINLREISLSSDGVVWSSNKAFEATAQNVTANITFTEKLGDIKIKGSYNADDVSFVITGNQLTVTYLNNHPSMEIYCYAENGSCVTVRLDEVSNINRNAPRVEVVSKVLSDNGRSLLITLSSSERAIFREGGHVGTQTTDKNGNTVYYYTRTVTSNGTYTYTFVGMSGLITTVDVSVDEIVTGELEVQYSTSLSGTDPHSDPSELDVMIGDKVFINPNRDVTVEMANGTVLEMKRGEWNEIVIPDSLGGLLPYIVISDAYGNVLTHQFSAIKIPDVTPPEIVVSKKTYSVRAGTDRAQIEAELLANFTAFDDMGGEVTCSVKFTENVDIIGTTEVEYIAVDSEGNRASVKEKLRITSIYEPEVYYGDKKLSRDEGLIVNAGDDIKLSVDCNDVAYTVKIKSGIRTEAQMKDGTTVLDYSKQDTVSLGTLTKGIYTVCIITQERDYFRILISVE